MTVMRLAACELTFIALLAWRNSFESGFAFGNTTLLLHHTYSGQNEESGLYRPFRRRTFSTTRS